MFFKLSPEPCATFGRKTLYGGELTDRPPQIYRLHVEFDKLSASEIVGLNCTYIATETFVDKMRDLYPRVTGVNLEEVMITASAEFRKANPGKELPPYKWLKIVGQARVDDFGLTPEFELFVSDRIFELLG